MGYVYGWCGRESEGPGVDVMGEPVHSVPAVGFEDGGRSNGSYGYGVPGAPGVDE